MRMEDLTTLQVVLVQRMRRLAYDQCSVMGIDIACVFRVVKWKAENPMFSGHFSSTTLRHQSMASLPVSQRTSTSALDQISI
jgi:hypothetical protein